MKMFGIGVGIFALLLVLGVVGSVLRVADWFVNDPKTGAVAVAKDEFSPREMLRKYEWFKDASAQLDARKADIGVYQSRILAIKQLPALDRTDREQLMVWQQEVAGMKASFNSLAAEYNAQMAKFNWRFANRGTLPEGATEPLPREYKSYQEN